MTDIKPKYVDGEEVCPESEASLEGTIGMLEFHEEELGADYGTVSALFWLRFLEQDRDRYKAERDALRKEKADELKRQKDTYGSIPYNPGPYGTRKDDQ
jgi:hypothetical protein